MIAALRGLRFSDGRLPISGVLYVSFRRFFRLALIAAQKVFVLEYLQARDLMLLVRPFFAEFDAAATWFERLKPAFPNGREFFPCPLPT